MKLLFDENLSPRLSQALADTFAGSAHVHDLGLGASDDWTIWQWARDHGFVIVTKDSDFAELSALHGAPPAVLLLRTGNCSTDWLLALLRSHQSGVVAALGASGHRVYVIQG